MRQARDEEQLQQQLHLQQRADVAQIALEMRTMERGESEESSRASQSRQRHQ
jgi:hypothetical protein